MIDVVHYSTQKQHFNVLAKVIRTEHFIHLRDKVDVVDFSLECILRDDVEM